MITFLKSIELWVAIALTVAISFLWGHGNFFVGFSNVANTVNNGEIIAWSYVVHRLHRHHKLLLTLKGDDSDSESTVSK